MHPPRPAAHDDDERLARAAAERNAFFEHSMDGLMVTAPDGRILDANPAACALLGYTVAELRTLGRHGVANPADGRWVEAVRLRQRDGRVRAEVSFLHKDGSVVETEVSSDVFRVGDEQRTAVVIRDVGARLDLEARLRRAVAEHAQLALVDDLTGLPNRRAFFATAQDLLLTGEPGGVHLLAADVDGLKEVNDCHGHACGDLLITDVATVLAGHLEGALVVARTGGDEFAALLADRGEDEVERLVRSLPEALERRAAELRRPFRPRVSVGVAAGRPATPGDVDALLTRADTGMYAAKRQRARARAAG